MCEICYEYEWSFPNSLTRLDCRHAFCEPCMETYLLSKLKKGNVLKVLCPHSGCDEEVNQRVLSSCIGEQELEKGQKMERL